MKTLVTVLVLIVVSGCATSRIRWAPDKPKMEYGKAMQECREKVFTDHQFYACMNNRGWVLEEYHE